MHFGNPFTYLQDEVDKGKASVFQPTIRENVESFEKWLRGTDFQDVEPKRRQWILDQINSGKLDNVPLVYYTTGARDSEGWHEYDYDTFPNHAHILLKLINERKFNGIKKFDTPERFNGIEESEEIISSQKTILSNEELRYWNENGVGDMPRILSASERTDPAFHV